MCCASWALHASVMAVLMLGVVSLQEALEASGSGRPDEDSELAIVPQRVWILMGGDSPERNASLASGLTAWLRLRTQTEVCPSTRYHCETLHSFEIFFHLLSYSNVVSALVGGTVEVLSSE